jgi:hypothetical protein
MMAATKHCSVWPAHNAGTYEDQRSVLMHLYCDSMCRIFQPHLNTWVSNYEFVKQPRCKFTTAVVSLSSKKVSEQH